MPVIPAHLEGFLVVLIRVGAILLSAPWTGSRTIPPQLKIALTVVISLLLFPVVDVRGMALPTGLIAWVLAVGGEVLLGITIGLMVRFVFAGVSMAGQFMGLEVGLSLPNLLNPELQEQGSVLQNLADLLTLLVFLGVDAHHLLLRGLAHSFQMVPLLGWNFGGASVEAMVRLSGDLWQIALRVGAPLIAAQFLAKVVLALLARAAPQMNVFMVGFPLQIGSGLLILAFMLPLVASVVEDLFGQVGMQMVGMLKLLKR
ncbi:MAG: flagellar biosynthetic protein FliR [Nitrospinae bacterium]|nr:flagellar biosynthetic protein FliR [Nitrospinota bacterium]